MNGRRFGSGIRRAAAVVALGAIAACTPWDAKAASPAGTSNASLPPPLVFRQATDLAALSTHNASVSWAAPAGVRVDFKRTDWPSISFKAGKAFESSDWSRWGGIAIEVRNPEDALMEPHVRIDDDLKADGSRHCSTYRAVLAPRQRATLVVPLTSDTAGMKAGPPLDAGDGALRMQGGGAIDTAHIVAMMVFLARPDRPRTLEILAVRWLPRPELRGIVDRFGQYTQADWPGKLRAETELARRSSEEQRWLADHRPAADRDEYGGWAVGPRLASGGFFRTELRHGRWWLVTPGGRLFWSIGATCVRWQDAWPIAGRREMFTWLPDDSRKDAAFYRLNLERKYGADWLARWVDVTCARLPAWGFNTIANWSDEAVCRARKVPYTATVHGGGLPLIGSRGNEPASGPHHRLPDFFDERFPVLYDAQIAKIAATCHDDPWCIGYFVDNELAWSSWAQSGAGSDYPVARATLASPPSLAARRAMIQILQAKYSTVAEFATAWQVRASSWDEPLTIAPSQLNAASRADCSAFMTALAERYFTTIRASLRKHAPQQLYLGCRFAVRPNEVVDAAAKYCDVVSFNIYADKIDPEKWAFLSTLNKPVVIGEFHFGATDRGMFHPGLRPTASQIDRARAYADYVRSAAAMPALVGCHWFQYVDEPLTGRFDGENYNIGLVTVTDTPYPELRDAAREVNLHAYRLHEQATR